MLRRLLLALTKRLEDPRIIFDREGGSPYLSRWYLLGIRREEGGERDDAPVDVPVVGLPCNPFLHRFHRSDDDGALHSHPWKWSLSFVLVGGYWEDRRVDDAVIRRRVRPFTFNVLRHDTFHRIDLIEEDAWTLFLAGPKTATWYFWDPVTKLHAHWEEFIAEKRGHIERANWRPDP